MTVADLNHIGINNRDDLHQPSPNAQPTKCFHCGGQLDRIFVYSDGWSSDKRCADQDSYIGLHPECATKLGQRLIKDGMIADMLVRGINPAANGVVPLCDRCGGRNLTSSLTRSTDPTSRSARHPR